MIPLPSDPLSFAFWFWNTGQENSPLRESERVPDFILGRVARIQYTGMCEGIHTRTHPLPAPFYEEGSICYYYKKYIQKEGRTRFNPMYHIVLRHW